MPDFLRPKVTVLPDEALVPAANLVQPPSGHATHRLRGRQPYFYDLPTASADAVPDGHFHAGTPVVLLELLKKPWCCVVDAQGLRVVVSRAALDALPADPR